MVAPVSNRRVATRMLAPVNNHVFFLACFGARDGQRHPKSGKRRVGLAFLVCFVVCWIVGPRASVGAEISPIPLPGFWQGGAYGNARTGKFTSCMASVPYRNGIVLEVGILRNYTWMLGFYDPAWNLNIRARIPVVLRFDNGPQWTLTSQAASPDLVVLPMESSSALIAAFRYAYTMTLSTSNGAVQFDLNGTSIVLAKLARCVHAELSHAGLGPPKVSSPLAIPTAPGARRQPGGDLGSGFFVTASGLVLTNAHVVNRCRQIGIRTTEQISAAQLLARDTADDLALLATGVHPQAVAALRLSVRQGDAVAVYGFPLPGLLAGVGNVTFGNITALAGVGGSSGEMQISAPVQPGNSGGPVLDSGGDVVGVVVAKLDALRVAAATQDIPQNVNFAIKATVATDFLQAQGVTFTRGKARPPLSPAALAAAARPFTVQVECMR